MQGNWKRTSDLHLFLCACRHLGVSLSLPPFFLCTLPGTLDSLILKQLELGWIIQKYLQCFSHSISWSNHVWSQKNELEHFIWDIKIWQRDQVLWYLFCDWGIERLWWRQLLNVLLLLQKDWANNLEFYQKIIVVKGWLLVRR